jgi:hypothetical protein
VANTHFVASITNFKFFFKPVSVTGTAAEFNSPTSLDLSTNRGCAVPKQRPPVCVATPNWRYRTRRGHHLTDAFSSTIKPVGGTTGKRPIVHQS